MPIPQWLEGISRPPLIAADEPAPAKRSCSRRNVSASAERTSAAVPGTSDKAGSPEVGIGHHGLVGRGAFFQTLPTHIAQQGVNALMIALNGRARPMQLQKARDDLKREKRHCWYSFHQVRSRMNNRPDPPEQLHSQYSGNDAWA